MQSIQTRGKHPDMAGQQVLMGERNRRGRVTTTGRRRVYLIQSGEPLSKGFDQVGSNTKFLSNIIKVGGVGGGTTGRGRAVGDAAFDWNATTADAASVTRRRSCGGTSQVAVGGVDGRSDCTLWIGINKIGESPDLELSES